MTEFKGLDETAVRAFIQKLQNGWANRIALINARYGDDIVCVAPDNANYFMGRMQEIPAWPAVFVTSGPINFREEGPHSMLTSMEVNVWVAERDQTGPRIATRLRRQMLAAIEVMYDDAPQEAAYISGSNSVLGPYRIFPVRTVPGAVFQPSGEETWLGSYMTVFKAEQEEL